MWHSPFQTHASGRNEIVDEWMSERDAFVGEMFDANYEPVSIDGQTVEAYGRTIYSDSTTGEVETAYNNM